MTPRHRPWEEAAEFTIGLRPIPLDAWLEGGEADPAARKDPLFAARRGLVWAEAEGSRPGQTGDQAPDDHGASMGRHGGLGHVGEDSSRA